MSVGVCNCSICQRHRNRKLNRSLSIGPQNELLIIIFLPDSLLSNVCVQSNFCQNPFSLMAYCNSIALCTHSPHILNLPWDHSISLVLPPYSWPHSHLVRSCLSFSHSHSYFRHTFTKWTTWTNGTLHDMDIGIVLCNNFCTSSDGLLINDFCVFWWSSSDVFWHLLAISHISNTILTIPVFTDTHSVVWHLGLLHFAAPLKVHP